MQGNTADYYNVANCCLDSVLATRRGLPITIAVLHKAVGNAAGMSSLQLLNMPGHVINAAQLDSGACCARVLCIELHAWSCMHKLASDTSACSDGL